MKTAILISAVLFLGCGPEQPAERQPTQRSDTPAPAPVAAAQPLLPDSMRKRSACPFECCVYGEWKADSAIPVHQQARAGDVAGFSIPAGTSFQADSGFIYVTGIALAIVTDTINTETSEPRPWLFPNDTLVLLEYLGEGYYNAWRRGEVVEQVPSFYEGQGYTVGEYAREWWVHVTHEGRRGWILMDKAEVSGADACGG